MVAPTSLDAITQIEECGQSRANQLLALGYRLLFCAVTNYETNRRKPAPGAGETFIRHGWTYVIGRTDAQEPFPERTARAAREVEE